MDVDPKEDKGNFLALSRNVLRFLGEPSERSKMRFRVLTTILFCMPTVPGIAWGEEPLRGERHLRFAIKSPKKTAAVGEPFLLHVTVTNPTSKRVIKKGRADFELQHGRLKIQVATDGRNFKSMAFRDFWCRGIRKEDHTQGEYTIAPGGVRHMWVWSLDRNISHLFQKPGMHYVRLAYRGKEVGQRIEINMSLAGTQAARKHLQALLSDESSPFGELRRAILQPRSRYLPGDALKAVDAILKSLKEESVRSTFSYFRHVLLCSSLKSRGSLRAGSLSLVELDKLRSVQGFHLRYALLRFMSSHDYSKDAQLAAMAKESRRLLEKAYPHNVLGKRD